MLAMPYAEQSLKLHYWSDMEPVPTFFMAMPNGQYLWCHPLMQAVFYSTQMFAKENKARREKRCPIWNESSYKCTSSFLFAYPGFAHSHV